VALNTDGAAKGNPGQATAGGVLRDHIGKWLVGFTENLGTCSSMKAEIQVVLRGLKLAQELAITKLWIQLDSQVLVGMLQGEIAWCPRHRFLLQQCRDLIIGREWMVRVTHCFREANQVANRLANLGITTSLGVTILQHPHLEVRDVLLTDCMGAAWPRICKR